MAGAGRRLGWGVAGAGKRLDWGREEAGLGCSGAQASSFPRIPENLMAAEFALSLELG